MGSFKGYSLLIVSKSAGSEQRYFKLTAPVLVPLLFVLLLISTLFTFSVVGLGTLAWYEIHNGVQKEVRVSLRKNIKKVARQAEKSRNTIASIVSQNNVRRVVNGLNPIDSGAMEVGVGGTPLKSVEALDNLAHTDIIYAYKVEEELEKYLRQTSFIDSNLIHMDSVIAENGMNRREIPTIWPTEGRRTSEFGYRIHPIKGYRVFHDGLDIANRKWTPVIAPADGVVTRSVTNSSGYGKVIEITHGKSGFKTKYAHLQERVIKEEGVAVKRGDLIGYMGNTGKSTGSHLHYEVIKDDKLVNPATYLLDKVEISRYAVK